MGRAEPDRVMIMIWLCPERAVVMQERTRHAKARCPCADLQDPHRNDPRYLFRYRGFDVGIGSHPSESLPRTNRRHGIEGAS
jgi:hypothetical protein